MMVVASIRSVVYFLCPEKRSWALRGRNPTRDIRVEGVPMAHQAPDRQRDWGPFCSLPHWTPESCLEKSRGRAASLQ
jgi:hypothetical protein